MARKSRKASIQATLSGQPLPVTAESIPQPIVWNTAGYARLSVLETRDRKDSQALSNQKALLREYIASKDGLKFCELYADNGETGTNFDRSDFQRMIADIKAGKINCIVVKDLSRFGRNCVETGDYLERVFPFMGVRFISIGDGYDSAAADAGDTLTVALKNLLNEAYSLDISRKSGSVLREKQQRGEFIGAFAAYGYLRDPSDVHHIVIDPETAPIVREIFRRKLEGEGNAAIVRKLNADGVLSPCVYRYQKGITLDKRYADGEKKPWRTGTIKTILRNPVYLGHMVQGRRRSELYAGKPEHRIPPEEWTIVEHTHEAIIDQETFDRVQAITRTRKETYLKNLGKHDQLGTQENIFQKLVFCADCGQPMVRYKEVSHGKRLQYRFICPNYAMLLEQSGCSYKYLPVGELEQVLSQLIAQEAALAVDTAALLKKKRNGDTSGIDMEITRTASEQERLNTLRERLMRDMLSEILSKEDHDRMKEKYAQEGRVLDERMQQLLKEQRRQKEILSARNPWLTAFQKHKTPAKLTRELVQALVKRIVVSQNNRIEIQFNFKDERAALLKELFKQGGEADT